MMINAVWEDATLTADGAEIAALTADNDLTVDGTAIEVSHTAGALRWQVAGETGEESFRIRMRGLNTGSLTARCGSRRYRVQRDSTFSTSRTVVDEEGVVVARTQPSRGTDLRVQLFDGAPLPDLAFITWALTLMDTPGRATRI
ncbi:hypothetical protein [Corynebacterium urinipleomorphum]|uniref:hypothetical protein n=1 Tax=Corynebacterium urinipleomorphum TaxID=1852380 RepID=UPI000B35A9EA|nr:hypothetical protein [Corynebacterium urinipleomorphum]